VAPPPEEVLEPEDELLLLPLPFPPELPFVPPELPGDEFPELEDVDPVLESDPAVEGAVVSESFV
jgi:hypothetical protein